MKNHEQSNVEIAEAYLDWMRNVKGRSPRTCYTYQRNYEKLVDHLGDVHLSTCTTEDLLAYVRRPRERTVKAADGTVKREIAEIRSLFKWMTARGMLRQDVDPTLQLLESAPTVRNEQPKPADPEAWGRLWAGELTDSERVAFGFAAFAGMRRAEVVNIAPHQVDLERGFVAALERKGRKSQGLHYGTCVQFLAERCPHLVPGGPETFLGPLGHLVEARLGRPRLLPWREERRRSPNYQVHDMPPDVINPQMVNTHLISALRRNGMRGDEFTPHQLRHLFCTNLLRSGVALPVVSRLAGHSSVQVTMRYIDLGEDPLATMLQGGDHNPDTVGMVNRWG